MKSSILKSGILVALLFTTFASFGQYRANESEARDVLDEMIETFPNLQKFHDSCYGYAVFPKVSKAGMAIGGAIGKGVVFKNDKMVATSKLRQLSVGFQLGGQQYSEVIFFKTKERFDHFMNDKLKLGAQASAIALASGISRDASYSKGIAIFTQAIGGLMYEASIGGQHFKNKMVR